MSIIFLLFKIILFYFFIYLLYLFNDKKRIVEFSIFDYVSYTSISLLFFYIIINNDYIFFLPLLLILFLELFLSKNTYQKEYVVFDGTLCFNELLKSKYGLIKFAKELSNMGVKSLKNVDLIIIKNNKLVLYNYYEKNDFACLVYDGRINISSLKSHNKSIKWLENRLSSYNINNLKYAFYIDDYFYIKQKK